MTSLLCGVFTSLQMGITRIPQAVAAPTPATDFLKTRVLDVLKLAALPTPDTKTKTEINQRLLKLIKPLMNFPEMSKASLGKHWGTRSPEERKRFISLFEELVFHSYIKKIRSAESGYRVEYEDESPRSGGAIVEAIAITSKSRLSHRIRI